MGAAIISGVFAVVLACLAWALQNGSRQARRLTRIERYTQILKDLPYGHPARAPLDAALAAEAEKLHALTGSKTPQFPAPQFPAPQFPAPQVPAPQHQDPPLAPDPVSDGTSTPADTGPDTMDDVFGTGNDNRPMTPSAPPPAQPTLPTPPTRPGPPRSRASAPLQTYASVALGLLAGGFAIVALWLAIDQVMG